VLAIAITLLVLDLRTADHVGQVGPDVLAQWPAYLAYVASVLYIGVVWVNHHALFTRIASVDTGLLWCTAPRGRRNLRAVRPGADRAAATAGCAGRDGGQAGLLRRHGRS
jgi:hypothetical protein